MAPPSRGCAACLALAWAAGVERGEAADGAVRLALEVGSGGRLAWPRALEHEEARPAQDKREEDRPGLALVEKAAVVHLTNPFSWLRRLVFGKEGAEEGGDSSGGGSSGEGSLGEGVSSRRQRPSYRFMSFNVFHQNTHFTELGKRVRCTVGTCLRVRADSHHHKPDGRWTDR
mmetsp:Transcript_105689/g.331161  ORF Transcript_105689/g.331161 Transcript_105689/m.331161 type:complete len:173 (-) Transcript_105689:178-696(-)